MTEPLTHAERTALRRMFHADVPRRLIPADVAESLIGKGLARGVTLSAYLLDKGRVRIPALCITAAGKSALRRE